jgi:uncharacterized protein
MLELKPERDEGGWEAQPLSVGGRTLLATMAGALWWPDESTLIVADLHLEKGSAHAARGQYLPPYDTRETLSRLAGVIDRWAPERVVALGDSLHDSGAADRLHSGDREALSILQEGRAWVWVTGNHDPEIAEHLGGTVVDQIRIGGLMLRHQPFNGAATHEVAGHLHPAARLSIYGATLRRPCFVGNGRRLVLPAFGAFTGGLNVLDTAFEPLFGNDGMRVWMLGQEGVYPVATRHLIGE